MEASPRTGISSVPNALRPATSARRPEVRSAMRFSDQKSGNTDVIEETVSEISAIHCSTERDKKIESGEMKAEQEDIGLPLLKGIGNSPKIEQQLVKLFRLGFTRMFIQVEVTYKA